MFRDLHSLSEFVKSRKNVVASRVTTNESDRVRAKLTDETNAIKHNSSKSRMQERKRNTDQAGECKEINKCKYDSNYEYIQN